MPKKQVSQVETIIKLKEDISAPLPAESNIGEVLITNEVTVLQSAPLYNVRPVAKIEPWWKFW